jgi:general secretion pathway protein D
VPRWLAGFCALLALALPLAAPAQEILLDFREVELARVVDAIAEQTGQRFLYDETLRGNVTISVPQRATRDEALAVLDAALLLHGFAALPGPAGVRRIARIEGTAGSAPWLAAEPSAGSDAPVTTLIRLAEAPAQEVGQALRQLVGKGAVLSEVAQTNAILIAANESQVQRLLHLARALDQADDRELRVLTVRYRDVAEIEPLLEEALSDDTGVGGAVHLVGDERTGSLVVDARREDMERVRELLRSLDLPIPGKRDLHVVRVLNTDAEKLAEALDALLQDGDLGRDLADTPVRIVVDLPTHSLVIQAPADKFASIAEVIAELDVPPQRVSIEITVVEVSLTGDISLGFDTLFPVTGIPDDVDEVADHGIVVVGTGVPTNVVGAPLGTTPDERFVGRITTEPILVEVAGTPVAIQAGAIVRADAGEARFHTVLEPHLLMTSGDEHRIQVGDNIPVPVSSAASPVSSDGSTPGVPTSSGLDTEVTFQRQDTGVDLRMLPTVFSAQALALEMELKVSEVAGTDPDLGPEIASRDVTATVRLRDGEVALVAALRAPKRNQTRIAVPFIGRIPILGQFFRVTRDVQTQRVLIVTAQPTVLGTPADEQARSIRQRLAFERQQARTSPLAQLTHSPYALLVDTRENRSAAETVASEILDPRWLVQLARWERDEHEYWDVYATGFRSLGEASVASIALRDSGWQPRLTVLPQNLR